MGYYLDLADRALAAARDRTQSRAVRAAACLPVALDSANPHPKRAAIVEVDGGIPREWAAGYARLQMMAPPDGVTLQRWRRFVDDTGRFLNGWAARAARLGWTAADLFGADKHAPCARVDLQGLVWLLPEGGFIVALTHDRAAIRLVTGARQTVYRRALDQHGVLAWTLTGESGPSHTA